MSRLEPSSESPATHFDLSPGSSSYGKLLIGNAAYEAYIEAGNHPLDAPTIADALNLTDAVPPDEKFESSINWSAEPLDSYVSTGQWLVEAAQRISYGKKYKLSKRLIIKANQLGLFPSHEQIVSPNRFKNKAAYYKSIGDLGLRVQHPELHNLDARLYLIELSDRKGYFPDEIEIDKIAANDSSTPSTRVLESHLGISSRTFAKEYGYWVERAFTVADCIDWGVAFAMANSGARPTTSQMDDLYSPARKGPSTTGVKSLFGSNELFWQHVETALQTEAQLREATAQKIRDDIDAGNVPFDLLTNFQTPDSATSVYGRYAVTDELFPFLDPKKKKKLAYSELSNARFIFELQAHSSFICADYLNETAARLGMSRMVWRSAEYTESLRIDKVIKSKLDSERGELSPDEKHEMEDSVAIGVDFLWANPYLAKDRLFWNPGHISYLRKKGAVPSRKKTERLFGSTKTYGELILSGYRRQLLDKEKQETDLKQKISTGLKSGLLPPELFHNLNGDDGNHLEEIAANYELRLRGAPNYDSRFNPQRLPIQEQLVRFARYATITEMENSGSLPRLSIPRKISAATAGNTRGFNDEIKSAAGLLLVKAGEIETFASMLGLVEYVYPEQRKAHLDGLKYKYRSKGRAKEALQRANI